MKRLCCRELEKFPIQPLTKIELYQSYELDKKLLIPSYIALCARPEPLTIKEGRQLGLETALLLAQARECARGILTESGARSPAPASIENEEMVNVIKDVFGLSPGPPSPGLTPSEPATGLGLSTFIGTISPNVRLAPLSAAESVNAALSAASGNPFTGAYAPKQPFSSISSAMHSASATAVQSLMGDTAVSSPTVAAAPATNGAASATTTAAATTASKAAANDANGNATTTGQSALTPSKSNNRLTPSEKQEPKKAQPEAKTQQHQLSQAKTEQEEIKGQQEQVKSQPNRFQSTSAPSTLQSQQQQRTPPPPLVIPQTTPPKTTTQSPARTLRVETLASPKTDHQSPQNQTRQKPQKLETRHGLEAVERDQRSKGILAYQELLTRESSTHMSDDHLHSVSDSIAQSQTSLSQISHSASTEPQGSADATQHDDDKSAGLPAAAAGSEPKQAANGGRSQGNAVADGAGEATSEAGKPSGAGSVPAEFQSGVTVQGTSSDASASGGPESSHEANDAVVDAALQGEGVSDEKTKGQEKEMGKAENNEAQEQSEDIRKDTGGGVNDDDGAAGSASERQGEASVGDAVNEKKLDSVEKSNGENTGEVTTTSEQAQEQASREASTSTAGNSESSEKSTTAEGFVLVKSPTETKKTEKTEPQTSSSSTDAGNSATAADAETTTLANTDGKGKKPAGANQTARRSSKIASEYWEFTDSSESDGQASDKK